MADYGKFDVSSTVSALQNAEKKLRKDYPNYEINWSTDSDGDFFVIANSKPFFYYAFDIDWTDRKVTMYAEKVLGSDYFKYADDIYGVIKGLFKPYINESKKSFKEGKNVKKSLEIIRRKLMELIKDDTIQEEFNDAWEINGIYDSVDDLFETSVHNVLHDLLKDNTVTILPF